jgi:O-antigen ligase
VIPAISLISFLQRYKDVVFPGLFLFAALISRENKKGIIYVLLASLVFNFFYQIFIFASPSQFVNWAKEFVYSGHFELVNINLNRARLFIETYDEIALPFVFLFFVREKKRKRKIFFLALFVMVALPSLLSNFRSRVLMLALSFLASLLFLTRQKLITSLLLVISIVLLGFFSVFLLNRTFGFSFVDRFALEDKAEDVSTVELRGSNIKRAVEMASSYPLFGVGLGNYYDYLPPAKKTTASIIDWVNRESRIASTNPHNIFAQILSETGLISLIFYTGMLGYFGYTDIKILQGKNYIKRAFVLSFWTLFSYSIFNPTTTLTYNSVFCVLRAMLI